MSAIQEVVYDGLEVSKAVSRFQIFQYAFLERVLFELILPHIDPNFFRYPNC